MLHILTILITKLFDEVGFLFWRANGHADKGKDAQSSNIPIICHHGKRNEQGRPYGVKRMTNPAVRSARDQGMLAAGGAGGRNAAADAAKQPVDAHDTEESERDSQPAGPIW